MSRYILALDQGTTSSRAILFDRSGNIIQMAQQEFTQHYPQPGWVEHNPNELFDSQAVVAAKCLRQAGITGSEVAAVGIANQRETTVVWNRRTGAPVYNAIVWQDRRTAGFCDSLREQGKAGLFAEKTGLVLDAYFSGTKVRWVLENVPGAREQAEAGDLLFGTVDSWLIWNFTKGAVHATDPSNASRTLMFNIHTGDWDDELLELLSVPRSMLPKVVPSSGIMGHMHPEFLGHSLPLAGDAGDQQAATYGNACMLPGMAKNTYGTGCFLLMNTGTEARRSENNLLTTVGWNCGYGLRYALEGSVFIAGAVVQWLRDGLQIISDAAEIEPLASTVQDNGGVFFVPAFAGLGAPYWDQYARGAIVGLTRGVTRGHIARAAIEAIALQTLDIMDCMKKDSGLPLSTLRVDGGASRNNMLMQCQANVLGVPVERPVITETTALGAAYLAGLAVGFWDSEEEVSTLWKLDRRFEPSMDEDRRAELLHNWHRAVGRAANWIESGIGGENRGRALFIKSALPRTPTRKNFDWWGGCVAGVRSGGKRSASRGYFSNVFFFVRNPFFIRRGNLPAGLVFNAFFLFYACRLKGSFNGLRVLKQGFDKDKSLWGGKAGIGEGRRPLSERRASSPPRISPLEKKNKKAGGCLIAKK